MTTTDLAQRVAEADAAQQAGLETSPRTKTILDLIRDRQHMYGEVLGRTIDPGRFVRVALASVGKNRQLLACDQSSLLGALMLSAQLGLEPGGPLGHAYLVPYGRQCTFIIGYRGYLDLARRSGQIASIYAEPVFDGDEFSWELGLHRDIVHRPTAADRVDPAKVTHVYAVARLTDPNAEPIFVVLTRAEVDAFRKRAKASGNGPWVTDWVAMARKTAVRRLATWLPMSVEIAAAASADERVVTNENVGVEDFIDVAGEEVDQRGDEIVEDVPAAESVPEAKVAKR